MSPSMSLMSGHGSSFSSMGSNFRSMGSSSRGFMSVSNTVLGAGLPRSSGLIYPRSMATRSNRCCSLLMVIYTRLKPFKTVYLPFNSDNT